MLVGSDLDRADDEANLTGIRVDGEHIGDRRPTHLLQLGLRLRPPEIEYPRALTSSHDSLLVPPRRRQRRPRAHAREVERCMESTFRGVPFVAHATGPGENWGDVA